MARHFVVEPLQWHPLGPAADDNNHRLYHSAGGAVRLVAVAAVPVHASCGRACGAGVLPEHLCAALLARRLPAAPTCTHEYAPEPHRHSLPEKTRYTREHCTLRAALGCSYLRTCLRTDACPPTHCIYASLRVQRPTPLARPRDAPSSASCTSLSTLCASRTAAVRGTWGSSRTRDARACRRS